ncbi:hypothetical protein Tco_0763809 [Tanacetum coccineum]
MSSSRSSFIGMTRDSSDKHIFRLETWKVLWTLLSSLGSSSFYALSIRSRILKGPIIGCLHVSWKRSCRWSVGATWGDGGSEVEAWAPCGDGLCLSGCLDCNGVGVLVVFFEECVDVGGRYEISKVLLWAPRMIKVVTFELDVG